MGANDAIDLIDDYESLVEALRRLRQSKGISCMELEERSGLQIGYVTKLENWDCDERRGKRYGRNIGPTTLGLWLQGLGVGLVVVDLPKNRPRRALARALEKKAETWSGPTIIKLKALAG